MRTTSCSAIAGALPINRVQTTMSSGGTLLLIRSTAQQCAHCTAVCRRILGRGSTISARHTNNNRVWTKTTSTTHRRFFGNETPAAAVLLSSGAAQQQQHRSGYDTWTTTTDGWMIGVAAAAAAATTAAAVAYTSLESAAIFSVDSSKEQEESASNDAAAALQTRPSVVQATSMALSPMDHHNTTGTTATGSSSPMTTTMAASMLNSPRNVMLHKMRSLKGRSLTAKYLVDWQTVLGEGAYGSVHPARLRATGEKVALKKITRHYTNASAFKTETDALLRIYDNGGHPNISGLRDMYEDHNFYYLILDLVTGGEMFEVRIRFLFFFPTQGCFSAQPRLHDDSFKGEFI